MRISTRWLSQYVDLPAPEELARLAKAYGPRLAVGIDARNGLVQVRGWVETTALAAGDLARQAGERGVEWIVYTDTSRDGMLGGPNLAANGDVCDRTRCRVIASGGVSTPDDIRRLRSLSRPNLAGAIVGKALYEGRSTLAESYALSQPFWSWQMVLIGDPLYSPFKNR